MLQTLDNMVRRFCEYGIELKYCDGFTHYRCKPLPALDAAYKTPIHASSNETPDILEKGLNPRLPQDSLRKSLVAINPTASSFKEMLEKDRNHTLRSMEDSFSHAKDKWYRSHVTPEFKVVDSELLSTINFNNIKGCKDLKDSFAGPPLGKFCLSIII
ncbi:hypothetical protein O181_004487 [Austropuccinia psidii MF-1]|uniref:Uncharacterized protein n=1 Tax=Austropuccinia psidii MF-1 TaxID=1389203 RepID=A0A9Q3GFU6_9BASI|nr:hypothetical protein [Austropuccinia psidii MF-1]